MGNVPYPYALFGTVLVFITGFLIHWIGDRFINKVKDGQERYRRHQYLNTAIVVFGAVAVGILWGRLIGNKSTFFGILGAGLAIALREPLLSIAGRIAIFAGHMYSVGDRIEI